MAFRAAFIGINKHSDPGIPELGGAVRDAEALHALFCDTFADIDAQLLLNERATIEQIKATLNVTLHAATDEDVVVISFAGHGTPGHQLVAYNTDRDSTGDTTLPMSELAALFQKSKARAILCILDACFSGEAPARVLQGVPVPRATPADYAEFKGKGRFLLAAASPSQPAWEAPGSGHGLLTHAVIDVLTEGNDTVDVTGAIARIVAQTHRAAEAIGENQDPSFVGGAEGELILPVLKRGSRWAALFPDSSHVEVGSDIAELTAFGLPREVLEQWKARFKGGLNELQLEAVNRYRVMNGSSLLVVAPTSSGKTFIGEAAAVAAIVAGKKAVFLLPYRALVNEKYEDFSATYGPTGVRVIRCTGDFTDETGLLLSGRYDLAILTYEMFLGLAISSPQMLRRLGLVALDEAQFITDPNRGITVELILTLLRSLKTRGVEPQLIVLSAVIGDINNFDEWLGCARLVWTRRPVPLTEGVIDRSGVYLALDANGIESEVQLLPRAAIQQRRDEPSTQDVIVPLVWSLVGAGEKVLVFRNTRGPAEGCARYLAKELGLPKAERAIAQISTHDLSSSGQALLECLQGGTAFHNSNLKRDEKLAVEREFRDPNGGIKALAATTTLAAGINTPASTVFLAEQEFLGEDGRPFTIAEYKNIAGRAGRLGFNETGKAIIYAETPLERRRLFTHYVRGTPEPITSSFSDDNVQTWVIRLLSQVQSISEPDIPQLLINTYGGFLLTKRNPNWGRDVVERISAIVRQFTDLGLVEKRDDKIWLTVLGRACGQSSLSFESAMRLVEIVRAVCKEDLTPGGLVGILQALPEADAMWTPVRKRVQTESIRVGQASAKFGGAIVAVLQQRADDQYVFWGRCKRAAILADWMDGVPILNIEQTYSVPFGGQIQSGDIARFADGTRFFLQSASQILAALGTIQDNNEGEFEKLVHRLEFGLPDALIRFVGPPLNLSRGESLALAGAGISDLDALRKVPTADLERILGKPRVLQVAALLLGNPV